MKKKAFSLIVFCSILLGLIFSDKYAQASEQTGLPEKMAHNIYMDPDLSEGSGEYRAFQIDFMGVSTPVNTYWALCNWQMKGGFGAYGGLQHTCDGARAIMSFWEGEKSGTILRAQRLYPYGSDHHFGGEGEGTNWITPYDWKSGQWYRMLFFCWDDIATGHTFVGQWVKDLSTQKWTLISYFDTGLVGSSISGGLSQFQENYWANSDYPTRSFCVKNIYAYDKVYGKWLSLNKTLISYDPPEWGFNTAGTHEFGATQDFFWGQAGNFVPDQAAYDASRPKRLCLSITQPDTPKTERSALSEIYASSSGTGSELHWKVSDLGAPVIRFNIRIYDRNGNLLEQGSFTRPEKESISVQSPYHSIYRIVIDTVNVYGISDHFETITN